MRVHHGIMGCFLKMVSHFSYVKDRVMKGAPVKQGHFLWVIEVSVEDRFYQQHCQYLMTKFIDFCSNNAH